MAAYTPGGWSIRWQSDMKLPSIDTLNCSIASLKDGKGTLARDEVLANARVMSSAPDLLEALERIDEIFHFGEPWLTDSLLREQINEAFAFARAAIARAKGEA